MKRFLLLVLLSLILLTACSQNIGLSSSSDSKSAIEIIYEDINNWHKLAENDKAYVLITQTGTINIESLAKWAEDFQNGIKSEITIMDYGRDEPVVCNLMADGTDRYTVYFYKKTGEAKFTSNIIYRTYFNYQIVGVSEDDPYVKYQFLTIPTISGIAETFSYTDEEKTKIIEAAKKEISKMGTGEYFDAILNLYARASETITIYGEEKPCPVVEFFITEQDLKSGKNNGLRIAVSPNLKYFAMQNMIDGAWEPLENYEKIAMQPPISSSVVRKNVDTSSMSSDVSSIPPTSSEVEYDYIGETEKATKLANYLRENLSPNEHGGISIMNNDIITLDIWVVNSEKVNEVLNAYTGDKFQPTLKPARCSYQAMSDLCKQLESIVISSEEKLIPFISQDNNSVFANIVSPDVKSLTDKVQAVIDKAVKDNGFPAECASIYVMYEYGQNPVT